ncbi:MAG TPA: PIN domain-containing protein [Candidatus Sulfomarinibacteraceae bacterium]|nr:PIN domain-containing protein [Candidatus Sulfomarinibacteraceae bacterium]
MKLSIDFFFRILGAVIGAVLFAVIGRWVADLFDDGPELYVLVFGLLGVLAGLVLTPFITTRPIRRIRQELIGMAPERLGAIVIGIFMGLVAAALFSFPLSFLPPPFQQIAPLAAAVVFCYLSVVILTLRQQDLRNFFGSMRPLFGSGMVVKEEQENGDSVLLDTSVIIDGRITDISKTGFIRAALIVPNFVLTELQHIADSADTLRRNRGRRGLEVLGILQQDVPIPIRFTDMDVSEVRDVDSKLVALARELGCPIMTNDYNLNRVAELQGVTVLNINDLANAVKAAYLPGEELSVRIIQEGKEYGQGVGYLDDGTMIVVEEGEDHINSTVTAIVTKVLQTTAGRMIFARLPNHG